MAEGATSREKNVGVKDWGGGTKKEGQQIRGDQGEKDRTTERERAVLERQGQERREQGG